MIEAVAIPILFVGVTILMMAAIGAIIVVMDRLMKRGGKSSRDGFSSEETRLIQEIHRGLGDMEKRIEALETILLDRVRHEELM